ncbi:YopB/SseC family type III secretion system translocon subunit [Desulfocurvus vexinensis]|uniref:YopB/SseC family type III secretion system translocon subunit n=1 Tax=Desulfocurvus vexinensis TaxID=399548 RepID=UPI00048A99EE|nr:YopB/SseC family type III secretion system translocon subunit [Desulfocurvus vexinensis]
MSLLGIDTSQLIAKYQANESEWTDVELALQKAFPGKSLEEIHAAATIFIAQNPGATMDELLTALQAQFAISISTELAAEIRKEWDEFSSASTLNPAELLAVLDDYDADSVNTHSQAYLMFLMQHLQEEIERLTAESIEVSQQADKGRYELAKEDLNKKIEEMNSKPPSGFLKWLGAVAAVIGAAIAVAVAVVISVGTGGAAAGLAIAAAAIACTLAVSAIAGAASDGKYSLAGITATILEACGVPKETARWIGIGLEITLAIIGAICSLGAGFAASGASAASTAANTASTATSTASTAATTGASATGAAATAANTASTAATTMEKLVKLLNIANCLMQVGVGVATGAKAVVDFQYTMEQAELLELKALMEKLLQILKTSQQVAEALLDAIFSAMRDMITETTQNLLETLMKTSSPELA